MRIDTRPGTLTVRVNGSGSLWIELYVRPYAGWQLPGTWTMLSVSPRDWYLYEGVSDVFFKGVDDIVWRVLR
jgi:hypothetical protein